MDRPPTTQHRVIHLHADAPPKPAPGAACNGCGVCCASEPCPLGMLLSRRSSGACEALGWDGRRYVCDALARPARFVAWPWAQRLLSRAASRWIAAGSGCDSVAEVEERPAG
ncbi:hypothetical protein [Caldimonas tepidiphila]|uniref:hypothetical protein n=1 Tax=Caldimonas tepidiphila TaxID=2315841 RepID=UPI000E5BE270|nr:hypothetical protein [Caldimonas tepidiphila]